MFSVSRPPLRSVSLTAVLLALAAQAAPAQEPLELRLRAFVATHFAGGDLPRAPVLSSPTNVVTYADVPVLPAIGIGLELRHAALPVRLRLAGARSLAREEVGVWGCADAGGDPLPCPAILIEVPTDFASTVGVVDLTVDVPAGAVSFRPVIGVAWLRYSYEWDPAPVGSFPLAPGELEVSAFAFRYGLGLALPVGRAELEAEYAEHRSGADRLRPDRAGIATVGASIPLL